MQERPGVWSRGPPRRSCSTHGRVPSSSFPPRVAGQGSIIEGDCEKHKAKNSRTCFPCVSLRDEEPVA